MGAEDFKINKQDPILSTFEPGNWYPIINESVRVALRWNYKPSLNIDFALKSSIVIFDEQMELIDIIDHKNFKAFDGAIHHKGDSTPGKVGDDEVITLYLNKIPTQVMYLAIVVNSQTEQNISLIKSGYIRLFDRETKDEIGRFVLNEKKDAIGLMLGLFENREKLGKWFFRVMMEPIEGNLASKSVDNILYLIRGNIIQRARKMTYPRRPSLLRKPKPSKFGYTKHPIGGEKTYIVNQWEQVSSNLVQIGIGWNLSPGDDYDLVASIMTFDITSKLIDIVYSKEQSLDKAITNHNNEKENGMGDNDVVIIELNAVNPLINIIAIVVNEYKGNKLSGINGFIRLFNDKGPIGCHLMNPGPETTGLLWFLLKREKTTSPWYFQILFDPVRGKEAQESVNEVRNLCLSYDVPK